MATLSIGLNEAEMRALRATLNPKQIGRALYQARTRTTQKLRVMTGDVVRSRYTIRKKFIDDPNSPAAAIVAMKPKSQDAPGKVVITSKRLPLSEFKSTGGSGGAITVTIDAQRPSITLRHGFKATVRSAKQSAQGIEGHKGIFTRKKVGAAVNTFFENNKNRSIARAINQHQYNAAGYAWRLPIEERYGPTVYQLIAKDEINKPILSKGADEFRKQVGNQISRFTDGRIKSFDALVLEAGDTET